MIRDEDRLFQPIICKECKKHIGWADFHRDEYQCVECNDLPLEWDMDKKWHSRLGLDK